jgi:DHA1 family multidrug resistance protein-like MFS transporter
MNANDRKIFGTLFFSIFAAVTGVGIVVPLLPVYAHDLGASGLYIGLIFGAFSLSRTFFLPYFGRQSDKRGRKPFIVTGLFSYAVISVAFILSTGVESLIVIRFVQGITSAMIMPVVQAYVGDITPEGKEGWVMGLFNMSLFIGLSAGPVDRRCDQGPLQPRRRLHLHGDPVHHRVCAESGPPPPENRRAGGT